MPGRSKAEIIAWGERLLRELWTQDGIPEDKQDAFLARIADQRRRNAIKDTTKTEDNHDNNSQEKNQPGIEKHMEALAQSAADHRDSGYDHHHGGRFGPSGHCN